MTKRKARISVDRKEGGRSENALESVRPDNMSRNLQRQRQHRDRVLEERQIVHD